MQVSRVIQFVVGIVGSLGREQESGLVEYIFNEGQHESKTLANTDQTMRSFS